MKTETEINAEKLYNYLKENGSQSEHNCLKALYPPVIFSRENKKEYFEYQTNLYGYSHKYMINGEEFETSPIEYKDTYSHKLSEAYQYLRKQYRANEKNNGYNEYVFYIIK